MPGGGDALGPDRTSVEVAANGESAPHTPKI